MKSLLASLSEKRVSCQRLLGYICRRSFGIRSNPNLILPRDLKNFSRKSYEKLNPELNIILKRNFQSSKLPMAGEKNSVEKAVKKEKIPIDAASFDKIRSKEMIYVDKTEIIYNQILNEGTYFSIFRPRRFGKSLLCSTLANMFGGKDSESLFEGLWIKNAGPKVWDFEKEKHPVIHLDMIDAAGPDSNSETFVSCVTTMLKEAGEKLNIKSATIYKGDPKTIFSQLIKSANKKFSKPVVVIIDEYDKPVLDLLHKPDVAEGVREKLQAFYSILKRRESELRLVFFTGMFKFSSMSMFSTLNNIYDLTFDYDCGTLLGYTEEELSLNFPHSMKSLEVELNTDSVNLMNDLKARYDGYIFGVKKTRRILSSPVFNPFAINRVFNKLELTDDAWVHSGSAVMLAEKIIDTSFELNKLSQPFDFSILSESCSLKAMSIEALAFYGGYLTIKEFNNNMITLGAPNSNIAKVFSTNIFSSLFQKVEKSQQDAYISKSQELLNVLSSSRFPSVEDLENIMSTLISSFPYNILTSEATYRIMIDAALKSVSNSIFLEQSTSKGRIDTVLFVPDQTKPKRILIVEYKYGAKASDTSNELAKLAIDQIDRMSYFEPYLIYKADIYCIGVGMCREGKHDSFKLSVDVCKVINGKLLKLDTR